MPRVTVIHYRIEHAYLGGNDVIDKPTQEITLHVDKKTNKEAFDAWLSFIEAKGSIGFRKPAIFTHKYEDDKQLCVRFSNTTHWMDVIIDKWEGFENDVKIRYNVQKVGSPFGQDPHRPFPTELITVTWWYEDEKEWREKVKSLSPDYQWIEFADEEPFKYCEDRNGVSAKYVYTFEPRDF